MHHHPIKEPPKLKFTTDLILEAAVKKISLHDDPSDSGYERGVIGLVAHLLFNDDWEKAQIAVGDVREQIEQDIADEIDAAKANLEEASRNLVAAEAKQKKGKS